MMVPDVADTCTRITELGGRVPVGPQVVGDTGLVFANVEDPDGDRYPVIRPPAR